MDRQSANARLVAILADAVVRYPDQRFGQLLRNLGFVLETAHLPNAKLWCNEFYLEPQKLLERVERELEKIP